MKLVHQLALAAALTCGALSGAQAQSLNYSLSTSDSPFGSYQYYSDMPCDIGTSSGNNYYRTQTMTVTAAGSYNFYDTGYNDGLGADGGIGIYSGAFNPASPATNCFASVDDDYDITLSPGTYTLVLSSYSGDDGDIPGNFLYTITGPAPVTLAGSGSGSGVAAVPTLSEWSLMLLAAAAAGLGARRMRRRGPA